MTGIINAFHYAPPATSVWDPALPGVGVLSNFDRTFTVTSSTNAVKGLSSHAANAASDRYFEIACAGDIAEHMIGLVTAAWTGPHYPGLGSDGFAYYALNGQTFNGGNAVYGSAYGLGDVIGVRLASGILTFYKNGASQGPAFDLVGVYGLGTTLMYPSMGAAGTGGTVVGTINTGYAPFLALPSGATPWG